MANDFKLMDSNSPTQVHHIDPKIRRVVFEYEICDKTGYPYPCSIHYEIDERTKEIYHHGATFHYGSGGGYDHVLESLHLIIEDLEGSVEYIGEPVIE